MHQVGPPAPEAGSLVPIPSCTLLSPRVTPRHTASDTPPTKWYNIHRGLNTSFRRRYSPIPPPLGSTLSSFPDGAVYTAPPSQVIVSKKDALTCPDGTAHLKHPHTLGKISIQDFAPFPDRIVHHDPSIDSVHHVPPGVLSNLYFTLTELPRGRKVGQYTTRDKGVMAQSSSPQFTPLSPVKGPIPLSLYSPVRQVLQPHGSHPLSTQQAVV